MAEDGVSEVISTTSTEVALCSRCASIDIDGLFDVKSKHRRVRRLMSLGELGAETESSPCSLCRLFYAVGIEKEVKSKAVDYVLHLSLNPRPDGYLDDKYVLLVVEDCAEPDFWTLLRFTGWSRGCIACSTASQINCHKNSLPARSIDARSIDFDTVRGWLQNCHGEHSWQCNQVTSSVSDLKGLKFIDCHQRRVVPALPSERYCALSYVWGAEESGNGSNDARPVDGTLPQTLPQTIEDAFVVIKELGFRYIWIDRYCIDQSNEAEKQIQIQQMDLIYQNAFITIIAAAGLDPYFGLPGVGTARSTTQPTAWIGGRCLVSTLPHPQQLIKASKWSTRAWTYQEGYFSSRRLFFTEQQVYFECRAGMAYEAVVNFRDSTASLTFDASEYSPHRPWAICSHLEAYSKRTSSVEADAIRAFQGIFNTFGKGKYPVRQYFGVPIMSSAVAVEKDGTVKPSQRSKGEAFAAGLAWSNTAVGTRRTQFPSWSWAGWTGPITYGYGNSLCAEGLRLEKELKLKVFIESNDGSLLDLDDYDDVSLSQGLVDSFGMFVHIEAWTIPINIQYMPEGAAEWIDDFRSNFGQKRNVSGYFAAFRDKENIVQIPIYTPHQTYENGVSLEHKFWPGAEPGGMLGIVLGKCEDVSNLGATEPIFVLIVRKKGTYFERIGNMVFAPAKLRSVPSSVDYLEQFTPERRAMHWQLCSRLKQRKTVRLR